MALSLELCCGRRPRRATWILFLFVAACALKSKEYQEGTASWYGPGFHGLKTASGLVFNQNDMTAAHPTIPLGTSVAVTHMETGRVIEVEITDRGPFVQGRIIDLSLAAARALGIDREGIARVKLTRIDGHAIPKTVTYTLQLGSFTTRENAVKLRDHIERVSGGRLQAEIVFAQAGGQPFYRVRLGQFPDSETARIEAEKLARYRQPIIIMEK